MHSLILIEDSPDDEFLSLRAIKNSGVPCEVTVLRTGADAISTLLSQHDLSPDLIILDFHLPNYNGLEVLRVIRKQERFRFVPIVMLSALETDCQFCECLHESANSCIRKPNDPGIYVAAVSHLVTYWLTVHEHLDCRKVAPQFSPSRNSTPLPRHKVLKDENTSIGASRQFPIE